MKINPARRAITAYKQIAPHTTHQGEESGRRILYVHPLPPRQYDWPGTGRGGPWQRRLVFSFEWEPAAPNRLVATLEEWRDHDQRTRVWYSGKVNYTRLLDWWHDLSRGRPEGSRALVRRERRRAIREGRAMKWAAFESAARAAHGNPAIPTDGVNASGFTFHEWEEAVCTGWFGWFEQGDHPVDTPTRRNNWGRGGVVALRRRLLRLWWSLDHCPAEWRAALSGCKTIGEAHAELACGYPQEYRGWA